MCLVRNKKHCPHDCRKHTSMLAYKNNKIRTYQIIPPSSLFCFWGAALILTEFKFNFFFFNALNHF